ncbi:UNVERIFIED_CONTAM: hypothetical protein Sradi_0881200 [Sesamum radiatum]|uniref:Reverse transcriptase Ty1/copia-type domain-containing protein n=1 Tax=Sesamum radiatum TaxID=300843 RepID=A0AAW2V3K7_SESRA
MAEGSSMHSHGIKMLFLVEKLEDLKAMLDNDTYIDVILQSLPPSYNSFLINYNMNRFEKSIDKLINMLAQYEATTHKSASVVLVGEASTCERQEGLMLEVEEGKGKGRRNHSLQQSRVNDASIHYQGKGHWKRECPQLLSNLGMFVIEVNKITNLFLGYWIPTVELMSGYALEMATKLLNIASSETVPQTPYKIWHGKPRPTIFTDSIRVLRRSTRESRPPDRYGFLGLTSQLDNDLRTYEEAISYIDSDKWLEAMRFEMDYMGSNQVRLVAKGYTQELGVDFDKIYSSIAMAKSIRILFAIAAWYNYEIWQMDVKWYFLMVSLRK